MSRSASGRRAPPTPGSTTARWLPTGMYGIVFASTSAPCRICLRRDPVRDVDDLRLGRDPLDHAVAGADEVVLKPEVAQEGDEHAAEPIAASEAGDVVRLGLAHDLDARFPRRLRRQRPDADRRDVDAEPPERTRGGRGREHDEIALRAARAASARASGRAGRSRRRARRRAACARPRRPAKSTRPAGRGSSASRPSCVDTAGTRSAPPNASAVARPIAATRSGVPVIRRRSSRAPLTLVTITQA